MERGFLVVEQLLPWVGFGLLAGSLMSSARADSCEPDLSAVGSGSMVRMKAQELFPGPPAVGSCAGIERDASLFSCATGDLARSLAAEAGADLDSVTIKQSKGKANALGQSLLTESGPWIVLYPATIQEFGFLADDAGVGLLQEFPKDQHHGLWAGVSAAVLYHELLHSCVASQGEAGSQPPAGSDPKSCLHFAIDYTTHQVLCALVAELKLAKDELPPGEAKDELCDAIKGLCTKLHAIVGRWSDDSRMAEGARDCIQGAGHIPYAACSSPCRMAYPALPVPPAATASGFPDDKPIPDCGNCSDVDFPTE